MKQTHNDGFFHSSRAFVLRRKHGISGFEQKSQSRFLLYMGLAAMSEGAILTVILTVSDTPLI